MIFAKFMITVNYCKSALRMTVLWLSTLLNNSVPATISKRDSSLLISSSKLARENTIQSMANHDTVKPYFSHCQHINDCVIKIRYL